MARSLTVAFWNLQNLFAAGANPKRGPQSPQELDAKLDVLAGVIGRLANGGPPDILALAEVANQSLIHGLSSRLQLLIKQPLLVFEPPPVGNDTGIAVLGLTPGVASIARVNAETRGHRPRALSVRVTLVANSSPLYLIACHWKSDIFSPGHFAPQTDRAESARWLRAHLSSAGPMAPNGKVDAVVVLGDFNTEPYAREIRKDLGATRHYSKSLGANGIRLFNCMWPWLVDPGASAVPGQAMSAGPPSLTSFAGESVGEPAVLDQMLVSRSVLRKDSFSLERVEYHRDADTARLLPRLHQVVPSPWLWDGNQGVGTSDHFPVVATLLY